MWYLEKDVEDLLKAAPAEYKEELKQSLRGQFKCGELADLPCDLCGI